MHTQARNHSQINFQNHLFPIPPLRARGPESRGPKHFLLIALASTLFLLSTNIYAQSSTFPEFPADRYHEFQIEPSFITQFLSARCNATSQHEANTGLFRFYALSDHYPTMAALPFSIFFRPAGGNDIFYLSKGFCRGHHITVPVKYQGTYFVTINDTQKPAILIIRTDGNSTDHSAEFRVGCSLHQGFNIQYLNRGSAPIIPNQNKKTTNRRQSLVKT